MAIPCSFTVLDDCSNLASWTAAIGSGCAVTETDEFVINGTSSFRLTLPAVGGAPRIDLTKDIAHSFKSDDRLGVLVYVPFKPINSTSGLIMFGSDQVNLGSGGVGRWQRAFGSTGGIGVESQGWQLVPIQFEDTAVTSGAPTRAMDYLSMRAQITASATVARDMVIDSIVRWNQRPTVVIQFDDGHASAYSEGWAYANPRGIPLTHFLISELMDQGSYVTTAQALEMHTSGDTIGSHGLATESWEYQAETAIQRDTDALQQRIGLKLSHGAYPNGGYGQSIGNYSQVQEFARRAGLVTCRTVNKAVALSGCFSPYTLPATLNLQTGVSLADAKAEIDRCIKLRTTCIVIGHKLDAAADASQWAISDWQALIDYIVALKRHGCLDTLNMDQWFSGNRPAASR